MPTPAPFAYRDLGSVDQFAELSAIYDAITTHMPQRRMPNGDVLITKKFKGGTLYAIDYRDLRYVEQNPNTRSAYADKARAGAKIMWIIHRSSNKYLGYVEDGVVFMK